MIFSTLALLFSSLSLANSDIVLADSNLSLTNNATPHAYASYVIDADYFLIGSMGNPDNFYLGLDSDYRVDDLTYHQQLAKFYMSMNQTDIYIHFEKNGVLNNVYYNLSYYLLDDDGHTFVESWDCGFIYDGFIDDSFIYTTSFDDMGWSLTPQSPFSAWAGLEIRIDVSLYCMDANIYAQMGGSSSSDYQNGYEVGYQNGESNGYTNGYTEGSVEGHEQGYTEGFDDGYNGGYTTGYYDGIGHSGYSFMDLFGAIGDTPILMIRRLFGFELFGTSLMAVFMSLFTALIVIKLIKKVF